MKKNVRAAALAIACVLVLSVIGVYAVPKLRVTLFVELYHEQFEEGYADGQGVPAEDAVLLGYKSLNEWCDGRMMELIILSRGDSYYGCYYSPDDVPFAFQGTKAELAETEEGRWTWAAEGDNHGETSKIMDGWYFFRASF